MKFYTIQHKAVWEEIQDKGFYKARGKKICYEGFKDAYIWINNQAKKRVEGWDCEKAIWLWLEKPDLRTARFKNTEEDPIEEEYVLMTLEIPIDKVLMTDFSLWHFVLNQRYLAYNEKEGEDMDLILEPYKELEDISQYPAHLREKIEASWERCICDKYGKISGFLEEDLNPTRNQAVIDKLSKNQVLKVKEFKMINKYQID